MRTILVGLGNPILGDDAVGWKVVEHVEQQLHRPQLNGLQKFDVIYLSIGGLGLMEHLLEYDRAVIVDAIFSGNELPGTISTHKLEEIFDPTAGHTASVHDTSLLNSINLAREMGARVPEEITVVGIETNAIYDFSENLTANVAAAIPRAAKIVLELLRI